MSLNNPTVKTRPVAPPLKPQRSRQNGPANKPSQLFSQSENDIIFATLGERRQALVTAKATLLTPTVDQRRWQEKESGAVCFVRDEIEKGYFIQVLCVRKQIAVLKEAVHIEFSYEMSQPLFLVFDGKLSKVGLNFVDGEEVKNFRETLDKHLEDRRRKRDERNKALEEKTKAELEKAHQQKVNEEMKGKRSKKKNKNDAKTKKERIGKHLISSPTGPVFHYGYDQDLMPILSQIGVSDSQLQNEDTRQFIFNFIAQNGGTQTWKNAFGHGNVTTNGGGGQHAELPHAQLPRPPTDGNDEVTPGKTRPTRPPSKLQRPSNPAPSRPNAPPQRPTGGIPPGLSPPGESLKTDSNLHMAEAQSAPVPSAPILGPPPPPIDAISIWTPPEPDIKHLVVPEDKVDNDDQNTLLNAIRDFKKTKKLREVVVDKTEQPKLISPPQNSLAASLFKALEVREAALRYSSDDPDTDNGQLSDENDWS